MAISLVVITYSYVQVANGIEKSHIRGLALGFRRFIINSVLVGREQQRGDQLPQAPARSSNDHRIVMDAGLLVSGRLRNSVPIQSRSLHTIGRPLSVSVDVCSVGRMPRASPARRHVDAPQLPHRGRQTRASKTSVDT